MSANDLLSNSIILLIGTFFGLLGNVLIGRGTLSKNWSYLFYALGVAVLVFTIWIVAAYPFNIAQLASIIISVAYLIAIWRILNIKKTFKTSELNPKVIAFTDDAKQDVLKLFAGDLNFLGNTPQEMEENGQYEQLKKKRFHNIHILCEKPTDISTKARYGKILADFNSGVTFKHYNGGGAKDLNISRLLKK